MNGLSPCWECSECGGRVRPTGSEHTQASGTEYFECVECSEPGVYQVAPGPDYPETRGLRPITEKE